MSSGMQKANPKKTKSVPSRRLWFATVSMLVLVGAIAAWAGIAPDERGEYSRAVVNGREFRLEVVDTQELRAKGLSGRDGLPEDTAMMFVFPETGVHCFWMKDMLFPIDIVWLDSDAKVVDVRKNIEPESYPESFCPVSSAQFVLEFPTGVVAEAEIRIGTVIELRRD